MREFSIVIALSLLAAVAQADCALQPTRIEALSENVGVFDKDGKYLEEIPKAKLDGGASLVSCNEDLGLIEVKLASGDTKWLDRGELRLTLPEGVAKQKVCVVAASSRAADHTEAAVAGVDPDETKACVPPK